MTSASRARSSDAVSRRSAIRPRKRFGQHFLEAAWVEKLIDAIDPRPDDTFLEIGPGRGAITRPLAERARRVIAFEIDRDLAALLQRDAPGNLTVVDGDVLGWTAADVARLVRDDGAAHGPRPGDVRVAGNLPYNVASPIMFKLIEWYAAGVALVDATLMLQREVADRLLAAPGSADYGVLTILISQQAEIVRLLNLPPGAFRPSPKVYSTAVRLTFRARDPKPIDEAAFIKVVQSIFTRRRKTLANALLAFRKGSRPYLSKALRHADLDGGRRPETLTHVELVRLADALTTLPEEG